MAKNNQGNVRQSSPPEGRAEEVITIDQVRENLQKLTHGVVITSEGVSARSPIPVPTTRAGQAAAFFEHLFEANQLVNVVTDAYQTKDTNGGVKLAPIGAGSTRSSDFLRSFFIERNLEVSKPGGAWVRFNPVSESGSGKEGVYCDKDVQAFPYALLECDDLTMDEQVSLFTHLPLPIVSITESGGRSVHALVKIGASDAKEYKEAVKKLLWRLRVFGVDRSNSNPSRLTRLPGALRTAAGEGRGLQRLLYLNPGATATPIAEAQPQ